MKDDRIDRVLAATPTVALPLGFRDRVMGRIAPGRSVAIEWIVAAALALPSLLYIGWVVTTFGADFSTLVGDLAEVAEGTSDVVAPSFFIDGLVVLAIVLLGVASLVATHALMVTQPDRRATTR